MAADTGKARELLAQRLDRQARHCDDLGSPFYAALLRRAALDLAGAEIVWRVLRGFEAEPAGAALALRLMGAVHRLVLSGRLPELALHYPSVGGDGDTVAAWPAFQDALIEDGELIRIQLARGCQTNEVGRSAALLGGFLKVAARTGMPLRILELGASAGLNLRWDRYRYEATAGAWGDAGSPVRFAANFDVAPPLGTTARVVERRGCDLRPIDPTEEEGALALRAFIWADQLDRLRLLESAIDVACQVPAEVERLDALTFLERELSEPRHGLATVVYHSVFMQYVGDEDRRRILAAIEGAVAIAPPDAPVAHLTLEPGASGFEVRLDHELLGVARAHGTGVRWHVS